MVVSNYVKACLEISLVVNEITKLFSVSTNVEKSFNICVVRKTIIREN